MASLNFNAQQHQPQQAFTPLPDGWYPVMITESEMKPTRDNTGAFLNLSLSVQGGDFNNRKLFARLNLHNKNPVAVEIAQSELSSICHVTGVMQLNDSSQLHGIPFQVKVTTRPPQNGYDASNEIKGYRDINGNEPGKSGGGASQGAPQAPQGQAPTQPPSAPQNAPQGAAPGGWQGGAPQQPQQQAPQQQGNWQAPPAPGSQTPPPQQPAPGQGGWQGGQQQVAPPPQEDQQQQQPPVQPPQDQPGFVQPPQGGNATPVQQDQQQQGGEIPPWQR